MGMATSGCWSAASGSGASRASRVPSPCRDPPGQRRPRASRTRPEVPSGSRRRSAWWDPPPASSSRCGASCFPVSLPLLLLAAALHPPLDVRSVIVLDPPARLVALPHQPLHLAAFLRRDVVRVDIAPLVHGEPGVVPDVVVHALHPVVVVVLIPPLAGLVAGIHAPVDLLP